MPLLLGFLLVALFIWFAENIGTWSRAWIYPGQADAWTPVSIGKLGAWYLLMIISFVLVALVHRPRPVDETATSANGGGKDPGDRGPGAGSEWGPGRGGGGAVILEIGEWSMRAG